jgi:hypothetical protein
LKGRGLEANGKFVFLYRENQTTTRDLEESEYQTCFYGHVHIFFPIEKFTHAQKTEHYIHFENSFYYKSKVNKYISFQKEK